MGIELWTEPPEKKLSSNPPGQPGCLILKGGLPPTQYDRICYTFTSKILDSKVRLKSAISIHKRGEE